jgi:hypothetical protein
MQLQLQKVAARYVPTRLIPSVVATSESPSDPIPSPSSLPTSKTSIVTPVTSRHITRQQLRMAASLLAPSLDRFQLVNGLMDESLMTELITSMPNLTALSLAGNNPNQLLYTSNNFHRTLIQ